MDDQVIDAEMARALHADAVRAHSLVGWIVVNDPLEYPGRIIARLVTDVPSPYILLCNTLADIHAALPPGLVRSDRQASDPREVIEVWFAP
jgi:hypothetical protein